MIRNFQDRPVISAADLGRAARAARRELDVGPGVVGFAFVDDEIMCRQHERFMGDPTTTDVLSFPTGESGSPAAEPGTDPYWGDVVICTDQAARQARERGHPYPYELSVLALHGVLHLFGLDHTRDDGTMRRVEERLRPRATAGGPS